MTHPINFGEEIQAALEADNDPESHVEHDPRVFHPSQIGYCKRQCYFSKLGLSDNTTILGTFQTGTLIHEWIEEHVGDRLPGVEFERPVSVDVDGVTFTGHADAVDAESGVVYDFKSRASWYRFDPPTQRHVDQLHVYMAATGCDEAQVVYVSKKDLEVKTWPEDGTFGFDESRFAELVAKAKDIRNVVEERGVAESIDEVPYAKCGCFVCSNEETVFEVDGR